MVDPTRRILSIDIFRGIAVLQMIFWQIFDFFAVVDIYSQPPFYIASLNMPINGIGVGLFTFISGASAYLSVSKRLAKGKSRSDILSHAIKRYGGYILLSLIFTSFVFGFEVFYSWNEAIQGIGLAALATVVLIVLIYSFIQRKNSSINSKWKKDWIPLFIVSGIALFIIFTQPAISLLLKNSICQNYPLYPTSQPLQNAICFVLNAIIRGFFSLSNLLPFALFGIILSKILLEDTKKRLIIKTFIIGLIILTITALLHSTISIDYYNRSSTYSLFFVSLSFLLFSLIEFLTFKIQKNDIVNPVQLELEATRTITNPMDKALNFLALFGRTAIIAYLFHFVFIYKPLRILGIESTFPSSISFILSVLSIILIYCIGVIWLKKDRIMKKWGVFIAK